MTNDVLHMEKKHYITIFVKAKVKDGQCAKNTEPNKCDGWEWRDYHQMREDFHHSSSMNGNDCSRSTQTKYFVPMRHLFETLFDPFDRRTNLVHNVQPTLPVADTMPIPDFAWPKGASVRVGVGVLIVSPKYHPKKVLIGRRKGSHGAGKTEFHVS